MTIRHLLPLLLLAAGLLTARAEEKVEPRFDLFQSTMEIPERGPVKSGVLITDNNRFSFIPPPGAKLEAIKSERKLKMTTLDGKGVVVLQVSSNNPALLAQPGLPNLTELIQQRYTNSTIVPSVDCYTGSGSAHSLEILQVTQFKTRLKTQMAFLALADGILELSMTTSSTNFDSQHFCFAMFLNSIKIEAASPKALMRSAAPLSRVKDN